jgi:GWxTD domain-containing protein
MMRGLVALFVLSVAAAGCGGGGEAVMDCYSIQRYRKMVQPSFDSYIMNVRAGASTRVDIYIQMQYERLRFVKTDTGYAAAYSMIFVIRNDDDDVVQTREVSRSVVVKTYEQSVSLSADAFLQSFSLAPGTYKLECSSIDQNSLVRYMQRSEMHVCDFNAGCKAASTILLLLKPRSDENGIVLRPLFPQTLSYARDSIGVFQELYNLNRGDTVTVLMKYVIQSPFDKDLRRSNLTMSPPYVTVATSCPRRLDSVTFAERVIMRSESNGTLPFVQYYPVPPFGYSSLELDVRISNGAVKDSARSALKLFRRKTLHADAEDIVEAMRYIARSDEFDSLKKAPASDRARMIDRFWTDRGGPARRAEFEERVEEANKLFSVCAEGSRTPMGIAYIICGPPEAVDCRNPYTETWFYTVDNQTMAVPFRIEHRTDEAQDFELPLYSVNEQLWRTFIDRWRRQ